MSLRLRITLPTFDELDACLAAAGPDRRFLNLQSPELGESCRIAQYRGDVHVCGTRFAKHLFLRMDGVGWYPGSTLCRVSRLPRGDSLYVLPGIAPSFPGAAGPPPWQQAAERLLLTTPPHGVTADGLAWYRVPPGGIPPVSSVSSPVPPHDWETLPNATRPTLRAWLDDCADVPSARFCRSVESFPAALRARLAGGPPAATQLLWRWRSNSRGRRVQEPELSLHVVVPPTTLDASLRLIVRLQPHDRHSRARFRIDAAFATANVQVTAFEECDGDSAVASGRSLHWKSLPAALDGIAEWVLGNLRIPGPW